MIGVLEAEELLILRSQVKHYERQVQLLRQTLRDEFAMRAMAYVGDIVSAKEIDSIEQAFKVISTYAYKMADAMMEARQK